MLATMLAAMSTSTFAETVPVNSTSLTLRAGGATGLSVSGDTVNFNLPSNAGNPAYWSNAQMMGVNDDLTDGFTIKITDIAWDSANNNAIAIVYGNGAHGGTHACESGTSSNFTLLVKKDGSVVVWGNGFNSNHVWGKWTGVYATKSGVLSANATEFTYKLVANEDNSVYTFYVNDTAVYEYNIATAAATASINHSKSIFSTPEKKCNFGFQVFDGSGNSSAGFSSPKPQGTLSFRIAEVNTVGAVSTGGGEGSGEGGGEGSGEGSGEGTIYNTDSLAIRLPGKGLSVSGNTVSFYRADTTGDPPAWSNAQIMDINDDIKDGFTLKLSNIAWDSANNNAIAIIYGNTAHMGTNGIEHDTGNNVVLLVKKDGSVVLWGNGFNSNHVWGKWTGLHVAKAGAFAAGATELTYKMVPNADNTKYSFYVNDTLVYEYKGTESYHAKSIFANPNKPCNFGFQVFDGNGNADTGYGIRPVGTLSFDIAEINSVGSVSTGNQGGNQQGGNTQGGNEENNSGTIYNTGSLSIRLPGKGLSVSGNTVSFSRTDTTGDPPVWSNAQIMDINDDIKDGFTVKLSNIAWDSANNNAIAIIYGNTAFMGTNGIENGNGNNIVLLLRKDGSAVLWGNGFNSNHVWGKWTGLHVIKSGVFAANATEITYKMVPNSNNSSYKFYVNDSLVYEYKGTESHHDKSIFANPDKLCNFGFQVFDGNGNADTGYGIRPVGTLSFDIAEINSVGSVVGGNQNNGNANTGDNTFVIATVAAVALMGCAVVVATKKKEN